MKPIISYYGGKQKMASKIIKYLPKHTVYVEPFVGGGAVLFAKPWPDVSSTIHYREVINDKDEQLINFYRILQSDVRYRLIEKLQLTLYSREEYKLAREICRGEVKASKLDRAWAYFVNISMSFGKIFYGGWGYGMYSQNLAATWMNRINRLPEFVERMKSIHIECDDAVAVIKRWDSPQTLFYCDPPYTGTEQGYKHKYTVEQYKELIDTLKSIKGSFVLSGYNNEYTPKEWYKVEFNAIMSSSRDKCVNKDRVECLWIQDNSYNVRPEIMELFLSGKFDCFPGI